MFGISGTEFVVLAVLTFFVIGPERMPEYVRQIKELIKTVRRMAFDARDEFKDTLGMQHSTKSTGVSMTLVSMTPALLCAKPSRKTMQNGHVKLKNAPKRTSPPHQI
ncbi:sec-independent translocase [Rothia dentocariosa]|uniref:Sec-independent translocase n=1 Tax=Rothia dentocariosa TaxID=2047 RepID=A0A3S4ZMI8_9MICC|nr:sec-independent translocase [Rothia dentocariosa]